MFALKFWEGRCDSAFISSDLKAVEVIELGSNLVYLKEEEEELCYH